MNTNIKSKSLAALTLGAIGVVYGDIGTSPLYTIQVIFSEATGIPLNQSNIIGAISAVFWALMLVVMLKYVILVLRADNRGEGGVMALLALVISSSSSAPNRKKNTTGFRCVWRRFILWVQHTHTFYLCTFRRLWFRAY